jgi:hypothetical protein
VVSPPGDLGRMVALPACSRVLGAAKARAGEAETTIIRTYKAAARAKFQDFSCRFHVLGAVVLRREWDGFSCRPWTKSPAGPRPRPATRLTRTGGDGLGGLPGTLAAKDTGPPRRLGLSPVGGWPGRVESSFGPGARQGRGASVAPSQSSRKVEIRHKAAREASLFIPFPPLALRSGSGAKVANFCVRKGFALTERKNTGTKTPDARAAGRSPSALIFATKDAAQRQGKARQQVRP